jgi:hypothetical protein
VSRLKYPTNFTFLAQLNRLQSYIAPRYERAWMEDIDLQARERPAQDNVQCQSRTAGRFNV